MDLKALLQEALTESNKEIQEEKVREFKSTVKQCVLRISKNNSEIERLQAANAEIRSQISGLTLKDIEFIGLDK